MTHSGSSPSLMDDREFLAELEQLDHQSPAVRPEVADEHVAALETGMPEIAPIADEDALDPHLFTPSSAAPRAARFDDEPFEPPPAIDGSPIGLVPVVLVGIAVGGGAAALVFHERLVRLLFGG
jgi:hypothetical protein